LTVFSYVARAAQPVTGVGSRLAGTRAPGHEVGNAETPTPLNVGRDRANVSATELAASARQHLHHLDDLPAHVLVLDRGEMPRELTGLLGIGKFGRPEERDRTAQRLRIVPLQLEDL
jgi:hypothetical protein